MDALFGLIMMLEERPSWVFFGTIAAIIYLVVS